MARILDEFTDSLSRTWSWSAILKGTFLALALFIVLRYMGAAFGVSTGDGVLEDGFAFWSVMSQMLALGLGALLAGYAVGLRRPLDGMLAGLFTWVVATVFITMFVADAGPQTAGSFTWSTFLGSLLSAGAALIGGLVGSQLHPRISPRTGVTNPGIGPSSGI